MVVLLCSLFITMRLDCHLQTVRQEEEGLMLRAIIRKQVYIESPQDKNLYRPERFVMALEIARAVQTPLPPPDISSPSRSFANRSFINSTSANHTSVVIKFQTLIKQRKLRLFVNSR